MQNQVGPNNKFEQYNLGVAYALAANKFYFNYQNDKLENGAKGKAYAVAYSYSLSKRTNLYASSHHAGQQQPGRLRPEFLERGRTRCYRAGRRSESAVAGYSSLVLIYRTTTKNRQLAVFLLQPGAQHPEVLEPHDLDFTDRTGQLSRRGCRTDNFSGSRNACHPVPF